jgi:aminopeptidase N
MAHGLEKERHDPTHDHVIIERIQQELWHDIEEHLQKAIDQALLDQSLPALQEGLQGLRETTVKRQEIDQIRSELKAELSGYLHEIIPSIAAQVIRDEIAVLLKESP